MRIIYAGGLLVGENIICWWTSFMRILSAGGLFVRENIFWWWTITNSPPTGDIFTD
jgi:hypothetical protein